MAISCRSKTKAVLSGKELLRIKSLHKQIPQERINQSFLLFTAVYMFGTGYTIWFFWDENTPLTYLMPILSTMLYGCLIAVLLVHIRNRGAPLIFTDKGIVLPHLAANSWDEIESYEWEEFRGWGKIPGPTVFSMAEGTCLRINLKCPLLFSRWIGQYGRNAMTTYLIFFSPEQMLTAETIFGEYAVQKKR